MELIHQLFSAEGITHLIQVGGLAVVCLIVFAETGVFPLLPGDSLLVICGMLAATAGPDGAPLLSLGGLLVLVPLCGVLGDQVGYWVWKWLGRAVISKLKDYYLGPLPIFKRSYLRQTEDFYARWGNFTIVAGRWVPFVRTFAPWVAGVIRMPYRTFISYNILGSLTWSWSMIGLGYWLKIGLQNLIERFVPGFDVVKHIDKIALLVILLSLMPIAYTVYKEKQGKTKTAKRRRK